MSNVVNNNRKKYDENDYGKEYFEGNDISSYGTYESAKDIVQQEFRIIDRVMRKKFDSAAPRHLDVGCAYGYGNALMKEKGWVTRGMDISGWAVRKAREVAPNVPFLRWDVRDSDEMPDEKFDLVTGLELFEHLDSLDVQDAIGNLKHIADWGLFVISARTYPEQDIYASFEGDHTHMNNHHIVWWMTQFSLHGELDFEAMFEFSHAAYHENYEVGWHNRVIVIRFD